MNDPIATLTTCVNKMAKIVNEVTMPLEEKVIGLEKTLQHCNEVMTVKQRCLVFCEQACHECDDYECGDNLSKKPATPELYKIVKKALDENDTGLIYTFLVWLFNADNDTLMRCFSEITDLHRVTLWMIESLSTISRLRSGWMRKTQESAKTYSDAICKTMGILDSAKIQQASLPERVSMLWERDITSRALLADNDSNKEEKA